MLDFLPLEPARAARLLVLAAKLVKPRVLGDVEGHPFHGNQWTDGEGGEDNIVHADGSGSFVDKQGKTWGVVATPGNDKFGKQYRIFDGEKVIAHAYLFASNKTVWDVEVDRVYQRRGIATKLYSHIEKDLGHKLTPSDMQSDKGVSLWKSRGLAHRARTAHRESLIHKLADSHTPKLEVAIRYAIAMAHRAMRPAFEREDERQAAALGIATLRQELKAVLPETLRKMFVAGGEVGAGKLATLRTAGALRTAKKAPTFTFNAKTQAAIDWADKHAAELIDGITETTREAINNATAEFLETGDRKTLYAEILDAIGDEERAKLIARNEPMVAVHAGQREAWDQATEAGLLTGEEEREWIVVGDEKTCPICEGLEGQRAKLGEPYRSNGEEYEGPPAHVLCRCSEGLTN